MSAYRLEYIEISRLRGFRDATLRIPDRISFLIGPNNSGKTSALRLLEWALNNASRETLLGETVLTSAESALLLPASSSAGTGRRITLGVRISHRGSQRRYSCDNSGVAKLRIGVTVAGKARLNVGEPSRGETEPDGLAWELLERLRDQTVFTLIPASRDAQSASFLTALRDAAEARIGERTLHTRQAGAYAEYRSTKKALDAINEVAGELLAPLWTDIEQVIPAGIAKSATVTPNVDPGALVSWLADQTILSLVTGSHDVAGVGPEQVGAGLQSLLELAINRAGGAAPDVDWVIGLEEPEAFLHPSAQRAFARKLATEDARLLVSTHSPIIVDEANYEEVVLVRDHRLYYPRLQTEAGREAINTALMTGGGAEMLFSRVVLLVEGPGDRLFFEELRRRLASEADVTEADSMWVVSAGGNDFTAWLKLLRSFGDESDRPIDWRIVADDDAAGEVVAAYRDAGQPVSSALRTQLDEFAADFGTSGRTPSSEGAVAQINALSAREARGPFLLFGELENAMLAAASSETVERIASAIGNGCPRDKAGMIAHLGADKAKWKRTIVARELPWNELDTSVRTVLECWLGPVRGAAGAKRLLREVAA